MTWPYRRYLTAYSIKVLKCITWWLINVSTHNHFSPLEVVFVFLGCADQWAPLLQASMVEDSSYSSGYSLRKMIHFFLFREPMGVHFRNTAWSVSLEDPIIHFPSAFRIGTDDVRCSFFPRTSCGASCPTVSRDSMLDYLRSRWTCEKVSTFPTTVYWSSVVNLLCAAIRNKPGTWAAPIWQGRIFVPNWN